MLRNRVMPSFARASVVVALLTALLVFLPGQVADGLGNPFVAACNQPVAVPAGAVSVSPGQNPQSRLALVPDGGALVFEPGNHGLWNTLRVDDQAFPSGVTIVGRPGSVITDNGNTGLAIAGDAPNVTVAGVTVEGFGIRSGRLDYNTSTFGAIHAGGYFENGLEVGIGWTIDRVTVRNNEAVGVVVATGGTVRCSNIHDNEELGIGTAPDPATGLVDGVTIIDNMVFGNNQVEGFHHPEDFSQVADDGSWGGIKAVFTQNSTISRNWVFNNDGAGIWCDLDCDNVTISKNLVANHFLGLGGGVGIQYEVSTNGTIVDNIVHGCGSQNAGTNIQQGAWGGGIQIADSRDVVIARNQVSNCERAVTIVDIAGRAPDVANLTFTDNTFEQGAAPLFGGPPPAADPLLIVTNFEAGGTPASHNVTFSNNTYNTSSVAVTVPVFSRAALGFLNFNGQQWDASLTKNFDEWTADGQDATSDWGYLNHSFYTATEAAEVACAATLLNRTPAQLQGFSVKVLAPLSANLGPVQASPAGTVRHTTLHPSAEVGALFPLSNAMGVAVPDVPKEATLLIAALVTPQGC